MSATEAPKVDSFDKISFIGCGKMAEAMIAPLIATGFQASKDIAIYDVSTNAMQRFQEQYEDIQLCESIPDCVDGADLIVAAIKPQNCCKVFQEIRRAAEMPNITLRSQDAILLSIIAGKPMKDFLDGTPIAKMARSMPNTPAQIGKGMTVWTCTPNIELKEREQIKHVLSCMGKLVRASSTNIIFLSH
jgi:pyrroline-5-carboxylate reductase